MINQVTESIGESLAQQLSTFVFKKRESCLFRKTNAGWQAIAIEVLPSASPGVGKLAAHARIRIDNLESIYTQHHPFLEPKDAKTHATLTVNCDNLLTDRTLAHGFSLDTANIKAFSEAYAVAIKEDVIPWLDRYSDEQAIYDGLASPDPTAWVTSDRLTRFPVLMAILSKRGDLSAFDVIASQFGDWCKLKHALVYAPLASAMLKMRPAPDSTAHTPAAT